MAYPQSNTDTRGAHHATTHEAFIQAVVQIARARLNDDDQAAIDWIFDVIADDFARLTDEPAIAA